MQNAFPHGKTGSAEMYLEGTCRILLVQLPLICRHDRHGQHGSNQYSPRVRQRTGGSEGAGGWVWGGTNEHTVTCHQQLEEPKTHGYLSRIVGREPRVLEDLGTTPGNPKLVRFAVLGQPGYPKP